MSHFEYVSVAAALIYALTVGRLLSVVAPALEESRRYWVHVIWVFVLLLVCVLQWWVLWNARGVDWTPIRFLWVLSLPAALFVRAGILAGETSEAVAYFKANYFRQRARFFSLGLMSAALSACLPWVLGITPWLTPAPIHRSVWMLALLSAIGLGSKRPAIHAVHRRAGTCARDNVLLRGARGTAVRLTAVRPGPRASRWARAS